MRQHTLRKAVSLEGVGLHSGKTVRVTLSPGPADSGIVFRVGDDGEPIPAAPESVVDSHYATTIGKNGARVQTIEHLMAAAAGLGIDNLEVRVDGSELPAADGSAKPFVQLMLTAGRTPQGARQRPIRIPHAIGAGSSGRWIQIVPADTFRISYTLDNEHPAIGTQVLSWTPTEESFITDYAPARTYGFLKDLRFLRTSGRALGDGVRRPGRGRRPHPRPRRFGVAPGPRVGGGQAIEGRPGFPGAPRASGGMGGPSRSPMFIMARPPYEGPERPAMARTPRCG